MDGRIIAMMPLSGEIWTAPAGEPWPSDWVRCFVGGDVRIVPVTVDGAAGQLLVNRDPHFPGAKINRAASLVYIAEQHRRAGRPLTPQECEMITGPALLVTGAAQWP
jgi:hypothetical protein